jgi:hypothetical protein
MLTARRYCRQRQREQDAGELGVDLLVVLDLPVAKVEETSASRCTAALRGSREKVVAVVVDRAGDFRVVASKHQPEEGICGGTVESPVPEVKLAR